MLTIPFSNINMSGMCIDQDHRNFKCFYVASSVSWWRLLYVIETVIKKLENLIFFFFSFKRNTLHKIAAHIILNAIFLSIGFPSVITIQGELPCCNDDYIKTVANYLKFQFVIQKKRNALGPNMKRSRVEIILLLLVLLRRTTTTTI